MSEEKRWTCPTCGSSENTGKFCSHCGAQRVEDAYAAVTDKAVQPPEYTVYTPETDPYGTRGGNASAPVSAQDDKNANTLCIVSIICYVAVPIIGGIISSLTNGSIYNYTDYDSITKGMDIFTCIIGSISALSGLAAWVLMIIARVKYPKNVFAKVLMWVYIGMLALEILAILIIVIACGAMLSTCTRL